jgi:RNA polymerase primary sigma factor
VDPEEADLILRAAQAPVSLERPVGDDDGAEFGHLIPDERAQSPFDAAAESLAHRQLREALENLSYRERRVVELRYGLFGEHPRRLDEIGRIFGITRERARQIEETAVRKLSSLAETQGLREVA